MSWLRKRVLLSVGLLSPYVFAKTPMPLQTAPQVALPIELTLKDKVEVTSARIYLDDLVSCEGFDEICQQLVTIDVGASPAPGKFTEIECSHLLSMIGQEFEQIKPTLLCPKKRVRVDSLGLPLALDDVKNALLDALKALPGFGKDYEMVIGKVMAPQLFVRPEPISYKFVGLDEAISAVDFYQYLGKPISVQLSYEDDPDFTDTLDIKVAAKVLVQGYLVETPIAHSDAIPAASLSKDWLPLSSRQDLLPVNFDFGGYVAKRSLRKGEILTKDVLQQKMVIRRGYIVKLHLTAGGVTLDGRGKALENGNIGEEIPVQYLKTNKILKGTVKGSNLVEVLM